MCLRVRHWMSYGLRATTLGLRAVRNKNEFNILSEYKLLFRIPLGSRRVSFATSEPFVGIAFDLTILNGCSNDY